MGFCVNLHVHFCKEDVMSTLHDCFAPIMWEILRQMTRSEFKGNLDTVSPASLFTWQPFTGTSQLVL